MPRSIASAIYGNLANAVSILGVLPVFILFLEDGYEFLIPLMIYNNVMDDLDGILATELDIKSRFGAVLDNLCDAVAHTIFVIVVGLHYGNVLTAVSLVAVAGMLLRVISRIRPGPTAMTGSPTNELIRHTFFILLLSELFQFGAEPFLIAAFALNTVSMLVPYRMPWLIRSMTKSTLSICLVNLALLAAWLIPYAVPLIAASFFLTHLSSFVGGGILWLRGKVA